MQDKDRTMGGALAPPISVKKKKLLFLSLAGVMLLTAAWGIPRHPALLEWRYQRMSLEELAKTRGNREDDSLLLYYHAQALIQAGRLGEAEALLEIVVNRDPANPRYRDLWAKVLGDIGAVTKSFGQLKQFVGTYPQLPEAHFLMGRFYLSQGAMDKAVEALHEAVRLRPSYPLAYSLLAAAHEDLGELPQALQQAQKAAEQSPRSVAYKLLVGSLLERNNQAGQARALYQQARELAPTDPVVLREFARYLNEQATSPQDRAQALLLAQEAKHLAPEDPTVQGLLGQLLLTEDKPTEAIPLLEKAADVSPENPNLALALSQAYRKQGDRVQVERWEAEYQVRRSRETRRKLLYENLKTRPKDRALHEQLGKLLAENGNTEGCLRQFAAALQLPTDAPAVLVAAANALSEAHHGESALPLARLAVTLTQSNAQAHEAMGNAYLVQDMILQAEQSYKTASGLLPALHDKLSKKLADHNRALIVAPSTAERLFQRARDRERYYIGGQRLGDEVEELAQKAVEQAPKNTLYLAYLLRVQMKRGRNVEAIATARRLLELAPDDINTHVRLGALLEENAATPEQLTEVETYLNKEQNPTRMDPDTNAMREYTLGLLALKRKDGPKAVRLLENAVKLDPEPLTTYYKLAQAHQLAGDTAAAQRVLEYFNLLRKEQQQEADALSAIGKDPNNPQLYNKAVALFREHEREAEAAAIEAEAQRRFGKGKKQ